MSNQSIEKIINNLSKEKLLSFKTYPEIKEYIKDWEKTDVARIVNLMTQEEKDAFYQIVYDQPYKVGEKVIVTIDKTESEREIKRISYDINLKHHKYYFDGVEDYIIRSNLKKISN